MRKNSVSLSIISKYRGALFGISIVSIALFHFCNDVIKWRHHDAVYRIAEIYYNLFGSIGVEVFLFLSGVGLYYSMSRQPELSSFYKKRLKRVLIPYLILGVMYWFVRDILITKEGIAQYFYDLSLMSFWCEGKRSFWFIAFVIAVYAAFPLLFKAMNLTVRGRQQAGVICMLLCAAWIALCSCLSAAAPVFYQNTEVALSRVPIFIIGTWYGKRMKNGESFGKADALLAGAGWLLIAAHMISRYGLSGTDFRIHNRFLACFFSVSLIFFLCGMLEWIHSEKTEKTLALIGSYSLELYITHVSIRGLLMVIGIRTHRFAIAAVYLLLAVAFSYALHMIDRKIQSS